MMEKKRVEELKREWKLAEVAENSATIDKVVIVREFFANGYKCIDIADILGVGKSYISKVIKVVKYLNDNGIVNYDFKKWAYGKHNTIATLYTAVGSIDKSETEVNDALRVLESKLNSKETVEKARGKQSSKSKKPTSKKSAEKVSVDKNNMVDIHHDGKHYRIPMDVLNNYLVK